MTRTWLADPLARRDATESLIDAKSRLGDKPMEFDKGKSGNAVQSAEKLPSVIDTLIAVVRNGELDQLLGQQVKRPPM